MQQLDYRSDTCEAYFGTYTGKDICINASLNTSPNWTIIHLTIVGGVITSEIARGIIWNDRDSETYIPHSISDGSIPSVIIDNLIACDIGPDPIPSNPFQLTCVSENSDLYILHFDSSTGDVTVYDLAGVDVTGTVTPITCPNGAEEYDIHSAGIFCDEGANITRYDIIDLNTQLPIASYFTDMMGAIVVPVDPQDSPCPLRVDSRLMGGVDITTDIVLTGSGLADYGVPYGIYSLTIKPQTDLVVTLSGLNKTLKAGIPYSRGSAASPAIIDITMFTFVTDATNVELIWDV